MGVRQSFHTCTFQKSLVSPKHSAEYGLCVDLYENLSSVEPTDLGL